jgi:hypothetical protein
MDNMMGDDYSLKLSMLPSNIRKEECEVLNGSSPFLKSMKEKKIHKMLFSMLDPRFLNVVKMPPYDKI